MNLAEKNKIEFDKPFCRHGHARTPDNLYAYTYKRGEKSQTLRGCKTCRKKSWKSHNWMKNYGITWDQYQEMFVLQEGRCYICHAHQSTMKTCLVVDHDHATGKLRKLLCRKCNGVLGMANDSITLFSSFMRYVEEHK